MPDPEPAQQLRDAFARCDAAGIRHLFRDHAELRRQIDDPIAAFDSPLIVAHANDPDLVEVLLEFGADPNRRSGWWAGGFHALHFAWFVCKHVKSNAIVLTRDFTSPQREQGLYVVGVGAGQMSRVVSVEIAVKKAGDKSKGSVLA